MFPLSTNLFAVETIFRFPENDLIFVSCSSVMKGKKQSARLRSGVLGQICGLRGWQGGIETGPGKAVEFLVKGDEPRFQDNGRCRDYGIGQFQTGRTFTADRHSGTLNCATQGNNRYLF
jgi:hypothetical protein